MTARSVDTTADGSSDGTRTANSVGADPDNRRWRRVGSAALGGALLIRGLRRRSLGGAVTALVGGWLSYRAVTGRSPLDRAPGSSEATSRLRSEAGAVADSPTVNRSVTIGKPADELSEFLHDPENIGRIAGHFADVSSSGEDRHRWTVRGPLGWSPSWEMRIAEDRPGEFIRWEPVEGAPLPNEWSVALQPAPGDRGTVATLRVRTDPPGGRLGRAATKRLGVVFDALAGKALDRFKSLVETGEIPTLERNSSARGNGDLL